MGLCSQELLQEDAHLRGQPNNTALALAVWATHPGGKTVTPRYYMFHFPSHISTNLLASLTAVPDDELSRQVLHETENVWKTLLQM